HFLFGSSANRNQGWWWEQGQADITDGWRIAGAISPVNWPHRLYLVCDTNGTLSKVNAIDRETNDGDMGEAAIRINLFGLLFNTFNCSLSMQYISKERFNVIYSDA